MGYQLIEVIEVGAGGAASIEFTGIPQDGVDLVVKYSFRNSGGSSGYNTVMRFNGDAAANYTTRFLYATSSSPGSATIANSNQIYAGKHSGGGDSPNVFGSGEIYISNYTSATAKSISAESAAETNYTANNWLTLNACIWTGTAAITSLIFNDTNLVEYSTASLYKITAD